MWIKRSEYERLQACEGDKCDLEESKRRMSRQITDLQLDKAELTKKIKELTAELSAKTQDCQVGQWCVDCKHRGDILLPDHAEEFLFGSSFAEIYGDHVQYCKKHLHDICPEFERLVES